MLPHFYQINIGQNQCGWLHSHTLNKEEKLVIFLLLHRQKIINLTKRLQSIICKKLFIFYKYLLIFIMKTIIFALTIIFVIFPERTILVCTAVFIKFICDNTKSLYPIDNCIFLKLYVAKIRKLQKVFILKIIDVTNYHSLKFAYLLWAPNF